MRTVLVRMAAMFLGRSGMFLRLVVTSMLVMVGGHAMVMPRGSSPQSHATTVVRTPARGCVAFGLYTDASCDQPTKNG